ncbi:Crp/Fnr family transcriptional regulator [Curvibacter sp. HBC61]|uniref:Crp/Fnr family transcriptional regulator n=1 Tax=Curvibacter cyanobacteriorum TaxID=3026422 RepID=A0ABT5MUT1_9BURK|nr:Crp/Fnr family transcriptional regulator [Curvibacter sp. HBC61]MDD0837568.1 Crp/Fnr family transcriptional regulator [Curvibacter sp. HBC61]
MIPIQTESAWRGTSDCRGCGIRDMALFAALDERDFALIHAPIDDLLYQAGQVLYSEGQAAPGLFTVRRGTLKLVRATPDGRERIVRLLQAGDVAGLEALATSRFDSEAVALTEVAVCRIPLDVLHTLAAQSPRLHGQLMAKWQGALKAADDWLAELNFGTARQRVAHLVSKMAQPQAGTELTLFRREDMGAMLDLKLETVSREVSALVRDGILASLDRQGRHYRLLDPQRLQAVCQGD